MRLSHLNIENKAGQKNSELASKNHYMGTRTGIKSQLRVETHNSPYVVLADTVPAKESKRVEIESVTVDTVT